MPSTAIKYLYAAFAEDPACGGASYYEDAVRCGSPMKCGGGGAADVAAANDDNSLVASKKTFDGSLEVGVASERRVFGRSEEEASPSKPGEDTPNTVPVTPDSSLELHSKDSADGPGPMMPSTPDLNPIEGLSHVKRFPMPIVKKGSFQSTATTTVCSNSSKRSGGSKKSRATTPDDIERARDATFREEENASPAEVSADMSSVSHPEYRGGVSTEKEVCATTPSDVVVPSKAFVLPPVETSNESSPAASIPKPNIVPRQPDDAIEGATKYKLQPKPTSFATSSMFTKEDVNAITPLQINTYLTNEERKKVGTKVLSAKLRKGYNLAGGKHACDACNMPLLCAAGEVVGECAVCPVLKKRVLKKILDGATSGSGAKDDSSFATTQSVDVRTVDLSMGTEASLCEADGTAVAPNERGTKKVTFEETDGFHGRVHSIAGSCFPIAEVNGNLNTDRGDQGNRSFFAKQSFLRNARQTFVDAFKTQPDYDSLRSSLACNFNLSQLEMNEGTSGLDEVNDPVTQARAMLMNGAARVTEALKEGGTKCQELDLEEGKEAVAVAGEMMVKRAAMVPEALKYKDSKDAVNVGCGGLEFEEVKGTVAHAASVLTNNAAGCAARCRGSSTSESNELVNDAPAEASEEKNKDEAEPVDAGANQEVGAPLLTELADPDAVLPHDHIGDEELLVEDASKDASFPSLADDIENIDPEATQVEQHADEEVPISKDADGDAE